MIDRQWEGPGILRKDQTYCERVGETIITVREAMLLSKEQQHHRGTSKSLGHGYDCETIGRSEESVGMLRTMWDGRREKQGRCQKNGNVVRERMISSRGRGSFREAGTSHWHLKLLQSPSRAMLLLQHCRIGRYYMLLHRDYFQNGSPEPANMKE